MPFEPTPPTIYGVDRENLEELFSAARQLRAIETDALEYSTHPGGLGLLAKDSTNPIRDWFIGKIVENGPTPRATQEEPDPQPQEDFTDARYWVRELIELSAAGARIDTNPAKFGLRTDYSNRHRIAEVGELRLGRWIMATNLSELGPGEQSHGALPGSLVHTFSQTNPASKQRWYFTHGSGAWRFAVIRDLGRPDSNQVMVQGVRAVPITLEAPIGFELFGEVSPVFTWPNLRSEHYEGFEFRGETLNKSVNVLLTILVDGLWYVEQRPRWRTKKIPPRARVTDCTLTSFAAGGLRESLR